MTARFLRVANASVLAQRLSFAGELGWELYVDPAWAVQVWDTLTLAGRHHGVEPVGYRAIDSLRIEKGFRSFGSDVTANDDPYAAGLGAFVARDKGFIGREALARRVDDDARPTLRTLLVGDEAYATIYGGEPVLCGDQVISRVRSCAYGHTVRRNVALAYLPPDVDGGALSVEVFGTGLPAQLAPDVLVPTAGGR